MGSALTLTIVNAGRVASVQVAKEDTGVSLLAHQDESVSQRLELGRYGRLESLARLGIVVFDECDRIDGSSLDIVPSKILRRSYDSPASPPLWHCSGKAHRRGRTAHPELIEVLHDKSPSLSFQNSPTLKAIGPSDSSAASSPLSSRCLRASSRMCLTKSCTKSRDMCLDGVETEPAMGKVAHHPCTPVEDVFLTSGVSVVYNHCHY